MGCKKLTIEFVRESFEKEGYTLLEVVYVNNNTKLNYICSKGHEHNMKWNNWKTGKRCPTCYKNSNIGENTTSWKGGVTEKNLPLYDTYSFQISYCEETRRDPNDLDILQVKCTKCNKWFTPTMGVVRRRLNSLNIFNTGEHRFYCSDECKHACPIFRKRKYSSEEKRFKTNPNFTSAELNVWSKEVLARADNICEYCGASAEHAHHIQPKKLEPFFALDPDNGIACCEECHYKYGHTGACSTGVLANTICG